MVRGFADAVYPRHVLEERDPTEVPFEIPDSLAIDLALDALDRHPGERTFLWVHLFGPHEPYDRRPNSDPAWTDYQSEVHEVDRQVGRLLEGLAARDERSDALVIVTADHGEELGDHGGQSHGLQAYEECIRVPLLVAIPAGAGRDVHEPVGLVDLSPTILSEFGLESPDSFEGFELGPALRGEAFDRPPVLSETWRVPVRDEARNPHFIAAVDGPMKVVVDLRHSTFAFYDLDADPGERENLVASISAEKRDDYLRLAAFALGAHDATP
jgi:arylsulfatase A-like enzyme